MTATAKKPLLWQIMLLILGLYTLLEFYTITDALVVIPHYLVLALCLGWFFIYPETPLIQPRNILPFLFLAGWTILNLASYIWAMDKTLVLSYAAWILRYMFLFFIYDKLFEDPELLRRFHWFLFLLVLLYVGTALLEMLTCKHLPVSRHYGSGFFVPSGPFYNENNLASYLLLFSPFLLFMPQIYGKRWLALLSALVMPVIMVIMVIQGARIAMLALGAFLAYFVIVQTTWKTKLVLLLAAVLLAGGIYVRYNREARLLYQVLDYQTSTLGSERKSIYMSSIQIRVQLIKESIDMATRSGFIGVGGGNYEPNMQGDAIYRTAGITNAHNYFMELLGNWGLPGLLGFLCLYSYWLAGLWKLYRKSTGADRQRYLMYLISLLLFVPSSSVPSSIRWDYFVWIYFAAVNSVLHTRPRQLAPEVGQ
ncbi:MAG TPA: O-antigen ligase family protein [Candidatus Cloacimonadota bacterium]|nr:O-antigen ligase family protein [Candidatus Cloacimonadota bacterium]